MATITFDLASTFLSRATFDDETGDLDVSTNSGKTYTFRNVPQSVVEGLRDAPSPGTYFHDHLKGRYT